MAALPTDRNINAGEGEALADAVLSSVPPVALHPLIAPSAGAFAAAAVMGFGFANQMAGAYLGFLKGAMEQTRLMAEALGTIDDGALAEPAPEPVAKPVPVKAKAPVPAEGATILPLARAEKPVVVPKADEAPVEEAPLAKPVAKVAAPKKSAAKAAGKTALKGKTAARGKAAVSDLSDLKRIGGIGPKLEQMLKARGIATLSDIAGLSEAQAKALDSEIGLDGRIERDGWIKAAAALVG